MLTNLDKIENYLISKDVRVTRSRRELIKLFLVSEKHLNADDCYMALREKKVSLPTIYRNLDILKRKNVIKEINIDGERCFEMKMFHENNVHIHFKCTNCGKIEEYNDEEISKEISREIEYIKTKYNKNVEDVTIIMEGYCEECEE
ncbi:Fur family transcriptional regulator [Helicovermis profundi]|uniref:Fur family transcriptional regulator n=1 Tax=Helicovermis profundi TaxID=3065157 RepID=A0AAU9EMQ5_9FIRM|nr:Fur family transcriptional regulator [Clostridia bacterium S502]